MVVLFLARQSLVSSQQRGPVPETAHSGYGYSKEECGRRASSSHSTQKDESPGSKAQSSVALIRRQVSSPVPAWNRGRLRIAVGGPSRYDCRAWRCCVKPSATRIKASDAALLSINWTCGRVPGFRIAVTPTIPCALRPGKTVGGLKMRHKQHLRTALLGLMNSALGKYSLWRGSS